MRSLELNTRRALNAIKMTRGRLSTTESRFSLLLRCSELGSQFLRDCAKLISFSASLLKVAANMLQGCSPKATFLRLAVQTGYKQLNLCSRPITQILANTASLMLILEHLMTTRQPFQAKPFMIPHTLRHLIVEERISVSNFKRECPAGLSLCTIRR